MHEFALAQNIITTVREQVTRDLKQVTHLHLKVGAFSGVVNDSLDFGLRMLLKENGNRHAEIHIQMLPAIAQCNCGEEYNLRDMFTRCPRCETIDRKVISGTEVLIESVEVTESVQ